MGRVLELIITSVRDTLSTLWSWLTQQGLTLSALAPWLIALAVIILLLLGWRLIKRMPKRSSKPEILVSNGRILQSPEASGQLMTLKISNLNTHPIQLLEIALKTELMPSPMLIEAVELVGAQEAIELEATLPNAISGDQGNLQLFGYLGKNTKRLYQLQASFSWEPWATRYRVDPTGQKLMPIRKLASDKLNQLRKRAWHEKNVKKPFTHTEPQETKVPQEIPVRERSKMDLEFPTDF